MGKQVPVTKPKMGIGLLTFHLATQTIHASEIKESEACSPAIVSRQLGFSIPLFWAALVW